jgi:hypothetical protein
MTEAKYEDARQALLKAWHIRPSADVGAVLGQSEILTERFRDAAEHLDWSVRNFPPARSEKTLQSTQSMFAEAKRHVASVQVKVDRDGMTIRLDGSAVATSPLESSLYVEPGQHQFAVGANDSNAKAILADPGHEYALEFTVAESTPAPAANATTTEAALVKPPANATPPAGADFKWTPRDMTPVYLSLGIGGALTAGSLVAALVFHGHASSKESQAHELSNRAGNCQGARTPDCIQLGSLLDDRNRANSRAEVFVAATAVLAVTTGVVTYLVWPTSSQQTPKSQPIAWATPSSAGLGLSGAF